MSIDVLPPRIHLEGGDDGSGDGKHWRAWEAETDGLEEAATGEEPETESSGSALEGVRGYTMADVGNQVLRLMDTPGVTNNVETYRSMPFNPVSPRLGSMSLKSYGNPWPVINRDHYGN